MRTLLIALAACTAASCAHRGPVRARSAVRRALPLAATASPFDAVAVGRPSELLQMLGDLKSAGVAPNFDSLRLAPRLVAQQELTRVTRMEPELLLGGKPLDYTKLLYGTLGGSSILGLAAMSATFLREDIRFALTYGMALLPIALLAVGSTAPGLLTAPAKFLSGKGSDSAERTARHEAAHLLLGYCCGLELESFSLEKGREAVQFAGETSGKLELDRAQALLIVGMGGMVAEYQKYGDAEGGKADLLSMQQVLSRVSPRLTPAQQQGYTRWAALMSWSYLQSLQPQLEATTESLKRGETLAQVLAAIEAAGSKSRPVATAA